MTTEEKIESGMIIYAEYRRKYYEGDFCSECERDYVREIVEACELNFYDRLVPLRDMCIALEYCQRSNRAVKIVLDHQFLSGEELNNYREKHKGNKFRLLGAGSRAGEQFGRSYHIEYVDRPKALMSFSMQALLNH